MSASRLVRSVAQWWGVGALILAAVLAQPASAHAQATLVNGLGGAAGYGPNGSCLAQNDDGYSRAIDVTGVFPGGLNFFGTTYTSMYVNTNGSISFSSGISQFTPDAFPGAPQPMIAPFWADVDTCRTHSGSCGIGYMDVTSTPCPNNTDDEVWWDLDMAGGRIIVTWDRVGYYSAHTDHRMSFQLILSHPTACGGMGGVGNFDVEFRFNLCQWETGDASGGSGGFGGTPAQSGFDSGMATYMGMPAYVSLPGSRMPGIAAMLCSGSNVMPAETGVWRFSVRGGTVNCPNAGMACDVTGQQGVCAQGLTNCVGSGVSCVQVNHPGTERCNGLDDDCNGMTDDGSGLCTGNQICVRGVCVDHCVEGGCFPGFTCDTSSGVCVETSCMNMTCPSGQVCRDGVCRGPCDGITCPVGQVCRSGYCVDPCNGVTCMDDTVCENGVCVPHCGPCRACASGQDCSASGACVPMGCGTVTCPTGQACMNGNCVDPCTGAMCPPGQTCMDGSCHDAPAMPDAGPEAGMTGQDASMGQDASPGGDAHADTGSGDARADARRDGGSDDAGSLGCGCSTPGGTGSSSHSATVLGALFAAAALAASRRRRN